MAILLRSNDALGINPPAGDQHLNTHGSDWLWTVTAIYTLSLLVFFGLSIKPRAGERIFHYIYTAALFVGAISYFAMASDLGFSVIATAENLDRGATYQVFFAKYINWVVSFPAVILSLGLLSGVSWATIFFNIFVSWVWVIAYLVSAYTPTVYKWGFFAFGTVAWIYLATHTLTVGVSGARRVGVDRHYYLLAGWVNLLWLLYPIAFGLSDGGNRIGVVEASIFFGVLDVLMLPVLAFAFIGLAAKWDYGRLNLHFTQYGRVARAGEFPEKTAPAPAAAGVVGEQAA